jgi:outer membrane protein OmpU
MSRSLVVHCGLPVVLLGAAALAGTARAESSVTVYGLVDVSVKYVDNFGGGRRISQDSGDQQGPRLGFQGSEDLGGGLRTVFVIETGLNLDTGGFAQGGAPFGRQVYLGFGSPLGTFTAGRQYDFMADLGAFHGVWQGTGTLDWNLGDNDRVSGQRLDNSLKYVFSTDALSVGALYSLRETSGATHTPSATSFLGRYASNGWSMAAAATLMQNAPVAPFSTLGVPEFFGVPTMSANVAAAPVVADHVDNYGAGVGYTVGAWSLMGLVTETRYALGPAKEVLQNRSLAVRYATSSGLVYAASVADSSMGSASWKRAALAADYFLSKRTDLYLYVVKELASGPGTRAVLFTTAPASGSEQHAVVAGIRHKF